jgi:predicted permease
MPLAPVSWPRLESISVDWHVLAFSLAALAVVGVMAATLPLLQTRDVVITTAMHEDGRTLSNATAGWSRLVAIQIAVTLPLIVGAALLGRSSVALARVDPGFQPQHVLSLNLAISRSVHRTDAAIAEFCRALVERVAGIPGVEAVGMVNRLPLGGVAQTVPVEFEGHGDRAPGMVDSRTVTPDYFRAMGIPLVAGRTFSDLDTQTNPLPSLQNAPVPAIGIIDEQLARAMWPGQEAVGRRFRLPLPNAPWIEIVGVVGHIRHDGLDVDPRAQVYFNYRQRPQDRMALVVRSDQDLRALIPLVLAAVRQVDPQQAVYDARPMQQVVDASIAQRRLSAALVIGLGAIAFTLAAVGLYGSISYGVVRRTREFGIRMALGETRGQIASSVVRSGGGIALLGATIGFAATVPAALFMRQLLFSVTPFDAASYLLAAGALIAVVITACFLPACRAASVDPSIALRAD